MPEEVEAHLTVNHLEYVQWYKADGEPLKALLPQDPYHVTRYTAKGWTRIPPSKIIKE